VACVSYVRPARLLRGGAWNNNDNPSNFRAAYRNNNSNDTNNDVGARGQSTRQLRKERPEYRRPGASGLKFPVA
jgi:hypothetical protein